ELVDHRNRQAEYGTHVQGEFGQILRDQRDEARIVRTRADFREDHLFAAHEKFDAEQARTAERIGDRARDRFRAHARGIRHRLRLPGFAVIAVDLQMSDRRAETRAVAMAYGQQRDLVIERDETLDDDPALTGAPAVLGVFPGLVDVGLRLDGALALAGRTHHRLDHA